MDSKFEDIIREETDLSPLVARKGYWYRAGGPDGPKTLIKNMGIRQFSQAVNTLLIKYRDSDFIKSDVEKILKKCNLEIDEIEERIAALINQKISEFQVDAKRRGHDLEDYI